MVTAGHRGDTETARRGLADPDPAVRAAALGALERVRAVRASDVVAALGDPDPKVRRRAGSAAVAATGRGARSTLPSALLGALADGDPLVVEGACWALGERRVPLAVDALAQVARAHDDARCREAAIAALGAIGRPEALAAVLAGLDDRPAVRRRAVVALAAFDGGEVDAALERARQDRDWQVRQSAEALLDP